jgi:hypothetical protein
MPLRRILIRVLLSFTVEELLAFKARVGARSFSNDLVSLWAERMVHRAFAKFIRPAPPPALPRGRAPRAPLGPLLDDPPWRSS